MALGVALVTAAVSAPPASAAPNMVQNPGLTAGAGDTFDCFQFAGWGAQTRSLTAVPGRDGSGRAARITLADYVDGDRKLITKENAECGIPVQPGSRYDLAAWYTSTIGADVSVFRHSAAQGWTYWYVPGGDLTASPGWAQAKVTTPVVPAGTDMIAWGVGIKGNGQLTLDDFSQVLMGQPVDGGQPPVLPPPVAPGTGPNLIQNGLLATGAMTPDCFQISGYGTNTHTAAVSSDVRAGSTGRSWKIDLTAYADGDRKLVTSEAAGCAPTVAVGAEYTATVWYKSTVPVSGSFFRRTATGAWTYWYVPNATLPASPVWTQAKIVLPKMPAGTDRLSFGVSLSRVGSLQTHDYGLSQKVDPPTTTPSLGKWTVSANPMPLRAMHATLLNDGRVLLVAGSGNDVDNFAAGTFKSSVYNPVDGTFQAVETPIDMFCSGHVTLPNGKVLVQGGTKNYPGFNGAAGYQGVRNSYLFDPATNAYERVNDTIDAHWYPTLTRLENGNVWMAGGLKDDATGSVATEIFDSTANRWLTQAEVPQTYTYWGLYPHMFLMSDARLFYTGAHTFGLNRPGTGASVYDWRTGLVADVPGLRDKDARDQAGSVLLPPAQNQKVMIVGGGHSEANVPGVKTTDIIDLKAATPAYAAGPDLPGTGKMYVNLTTLPDRTVLASNGGTNNRAGSVLTAALFDPQANTWTSVEPDPVPRNYHSVSILLKDGRVAVFGSNPGDGSYELRVSMYEPPYLFKGARPTITAAPATLNYGASVPISVTGAVTGASLTSLRSATHQTDTNERLVDLPLSGTGGTRTATVPANTALLPPGPYMLTVLDSTGIPSVATVVNVR